MSNIISMRATDEEIQLLDGVCRSLRVKRSDLLREILADYVEQERKKFEVSV